MTDEPESEDAGEGSVEQRVAKANPPPEPKDALDEENRKLDTKRKASDIRLGKVVAYGALIAMALQIAAANCAFYLYGHAIQWKYPVTAMNGWLAATVIQVVGVVLVITRYLFPAGGGRS